MGEAAQIAKKGRISKFRKWINDERVFAYVLNIPSIFIILLLVGRLLISYMGMVVGIPCCCCIVLLV